MLVFKRKKNNFCLKFFFLLLLNSTLWKTCTIYKCFDEMKQKEGAEKKVFHKSRLFVIRKGSERVESHA